MPEALNNPAPKLNSEQLWALKRRTEEEKRNLKDQVYASFILTRAPPLLEGR